MRAPVWARVMVALLWIALGLLTWCYVSTHDVERTWMQLQAGDRVTWPPAGRNQTDQGLVDAALNTASDTVGRAARPVALLALLAAASVVISRVVHRRARARSMARWELRLGRDDLANPYQVQEAFEGITGALGVRWWERVWRGPDHFALEIHRMPDESIRFTAAIKRGLESAIRGPLEDLYPDVELIEVAGQPTWGHCVVRLKKTKSFVLSIQTTRNYEHAFCESLVALMGTADRELTIQFVLTPAPGSVHRRARKLLKRRERSLQHADQRDAGELGIDSIVESKELKGALELQHRSLLYFDLRVTGTQASEVRRVAGSFSQLRSENELGRREMRVRRTLYRGRITNAMPNPVPGLRVGVLSTSELPTLWQLPRARVKHARLHRSSVRRATAPPEIDRDQSRLLLRDERGPISMAASDRKYGHALIGGQGGGKSSVMARHVLNDVRESDRAVILIDPKGPLAELCLGLIPAERTVQYLDLGCPEVGFNPLSIDASPGARAAVFLQALIEANPPGAIQAASDSFLRQAVSAVCTVEREPTLWHVYRMLDFGASTYREKVVAQLNETTGAEFAKRYWQREFPSLLADRGFASKALNPPRNKIERLISTREIDTLLRHPVSLDLEGILERGEVLVVAGAKSTVGEDNTILVSHLLLQVLHRAIQAQQNLPQERRSTVSLLIDEAHNVLTPSVAKMLAEGRSAGLEAVFAWQYSAQIRDEIIRSGVRSLLQSISIFRMREIEDARSLAGLAMEVYSDSISTEQDEQERLRFSPDDILRLPIHRAINLWVADGVPRSGFLAHTLPMEELYDPDLAEHHRAAQRARGGHHPQELPTLLDTDEETLNGLSNGQQASTPKRKPPPGNRKEASSSRPKRSSAAQGQSSSEPHPRDPYEGQLQFLPDDAQRLGG